MGTWTYFPIDKVCSVNGCNTRATQRVVHRYTKKHGVYCKKHAVQWVTRENRKQDKEKK